MEGRTVFTRLVLFVYFIFSVVFFRNAFSKVVIMCSRMPFIPITRSDCSEHSNADVTFSWHIWKLRRVSEGCVRVTSGPADSTPPSAAGICGMFVLNKLTVTQRPCAHCLHGNVFNRGVLVADGIWCTVGNIWVRFTSAVTERGKNVEGGKKWVKQGFLFWVGDGPVIDIQSDHAWERRVFGCVFHAPL